MSRNFLHQLNTTDITCLFVAQVVSRIIKVKVCVTQEYVSLYVIAHFDTLLQMSTSI